MPTALFAKTRTAGLLALTLTLALAASAAAPAQASRLLIEKAPIDSGSDMSSSDDHHDCDSRREVKYYFEDYGLEHIKVSKTHDYYIYKVSGFALPSMMQPAVSKLSKDSHDYVRYVYLFDACEHEIIEQLQPRNVT